MRGIISRDHEQNIGCDMCMLSLLRFILNVPCRDHSISQDNNNVTRVGIGSCPIIPLGECGYTNGHGSELPNFISGRNPNILFWQSISFKCSAGLSSPRDGALQLLLSSI
jgi:hypothetical protein